MLSVSTIGIIIVCFIIETLLTQRTTYGESVYLKRTLHSVNISSFPFRSQPPLRPPVSRPPGSRPPGSRPPVSRPPGSRPPGSRPPGSRPSPQSPDAIAHIVPRKRFRRLGRLLGLGEERPTCSVNQCRNQGLCQTDVQAVGGFVCHCPLGYYGPICDVVTPDCESNPCRHGAICVVIETGFRCDCAPDFSGVRCELDGSGEVIPPRGSKTNFTLGIAAAVMGGMIIVGLCLLYVEKHRTRLKDFNAMYAGPIKFRTSTPAVLLVMFSEFREFACGHAAGARGERRKSRLSNKLRILKQHERDKKKQEKAKLRAERGEDAASLKSSPSSSSSLSSSTSSMSSSSSSSSDSFVPLTPPPSSSDSSESFAPPAPPSAYFSASGLPPLPTPSSASSAPSPPSSEGK